MSSTARNSRVLWLFLMASLTFFTCSENVTNPDKNTIPEYGLIYFPAGGGGESPMIELTFSSKNGQVIDTTLSNCYYYSMEFTDDGAMAIYVGGYAVPPEQRNEMAWVVNQFTGDTLSKYIGWTGIKPVLGPDKSRLLITGAGFMLFDFPSLNLVHDIVFEPGSNWPIDGGFMTAGNKLFYFCESKDTIFVLDFTNPGSVSETAAPISFDGQPVFPTSSLVDYRNEHIILIATNMSGKKDIVVFGSDDLSFIKGIHTDHYYSHLVEHPDGNRIFLGAIAAYTVSPDENRIDIYDISQNVINSFVGVHDIDSMSYFQPDQMVITPDGGMLYVRATEYYDGSDAFTINWPAVGIRISDRAPVQYLNPAVAHSTTISVNPIMISEAD
ncbi:MAG: hypothetical protein CVT49_12405 [candidate division Zixibacteria bacterium HGW-Zixibacteria-1]|nr:MAG: hypothetical protein CVT49_12405 [candidate division Zixibacteria bacterium HGW-Zixibacteria-1]